MSTCTECGFTYGVLAHRELPARMRATVTCGRKRSRPGSQERLRASAAASEAQWARPLIYNFPRPARRDVEWMAHHAVHEMVHHLGDVDRILGSQ